MGTLLLASSEDVASMGILSAIRGLGGWEEPKQHKHGLVWDHSSCDVQVLLIKGLHIRADGIDLEHESETGVRVEEVLVLSRHVSASETPALTLHAIGVPGETPPGEPGQAGGIKGKVVPPSPRFGALFRTMQTIASERLLNQEYDLTLESTHHGPLLTRPTLFIEIGSTEDRWADSRAAEVWADSISLCLGLSGDCQIGLWEGEGDVMVGLGGGHYAPRHKAVITQSGVWVGHILANYALVFDQPREEGQMPMGPWKNSVAVAIESTREAFPGGNVFAHLDRKSFKGWQRQAILSLLSNLEVPVLRGNQIS